VRGALALALAVALGGLIELVQLPLPYRDGQLVDIVVNAAGAAAGLAVFTYVARTAERVPQYGLEHTVPVGSRAFADSLAGLAGTTC